ncbi:MAG: alpha-2-macroglobulin family protein [Hyphomicrobiaceae bacterium]|nr:alpha-2-macroglobulin family protein [Hyphomicrobiaceae bacterium]
MRIRPLLAAAATAFVLFGSGLVPAPVLIPAVSAQTAAPAKAWVRDDLASEAIRLEATILKEIKPSGRPQAQLKAEAIRLAGLGEWRKSYDFARQSIAALPTDWQAWRLLAEAAVEISPKDYSEKWQMQQVGLTAAYAAYQRTTSASDEADALATLSYAYSHREYWRAAIDTMKLSIERKDDPERRDRYVELREEHGFRILDYKVDSDSASPRVCVEFSEDLSRTQKDFSPFVVVSGAKKPAIVAEGQQLCVEGMEHGGKYQIVVRQGLPSTVGEALLKNADYDIYVRDRAPAVRFSGRNYVLPRTGQEGLPVTSVNTSEVAIGLYRIGDRSLLETLRNGGFLDQISPYQANQIGEEKGKAIWRGSLATKSDLNQDVVTAFPVLEAVGRLEPGLYVMTAEPGPLKATGSDEEDWDERATQWFVVSDIGLTALKGNDGVNVLVRSLASAKPMADVEVRLIARNNEVLASTRSDASGLVTFAAGLTRGQGGSAPVLLVASTGEGDYGFVDLDKSAFDLADRGVKGRTAPGPLDALVVTERGVYRSGETVQVTTLLRDALGASVGDMPLTLIVYRPDGVEYRKVSVADQGEGGRALSVTLLSGIQTGTWRVAAFTDPKRPAIGETTFLVEDYLPERLDVTLAPKSERLAAGSPAEIGVDVRYLYGAPGADLNIAGNIAVTLAEGLTIPGLAGYEAGLADEEFEAIDQPLEETATTDAKGHADMAINIPETTTSRGLQATITLRAEETGGRAVARSVTLPILPPQPVIAVKKLFDPGSISAGAQAKFAVVAAGPDGTRLNLKNVRWELRKVTTRWQWFRSDGSWNSEKVVNSARVADGQMALGAGDPAQLAVPVDWGSYRLDVVADGGEAARVSVMFNVGWGSGGASADAPDGLDVAIDKAAYKAGETIEARITSRFAGTATIAVIADTIKSTQVIDIPAGGSTVSLKADPAWGAGAYLVAFAHRPLDVQAHRMPGRAIGLKWFAIEPEARRLEVTLSAPAQMRPHGPLAIPVKLSGMAAGEKAFVTISAVDVGILNLTGYKTPNPHEHYFGQRSLATEIRDIYGSLIDGMQGARGAIRSGGDESQAELGGSPPREAPLAFYSGVVEVGADGTARVAFEIPGFAGTLRVAVLAWSKSRVGSASADVIVRDPVVTTATLPRFISLGDVSTLHVDVDNVEGAAGDYTVDVDIRGPISIPADVARSTLKLAAKGRAGIDLPVTATGMGTAHVDLRLIGPGGIDVTRQMVLGAQPATPVVDRRTIRPLAAGASVTLSNDLFAEFLPGTGRLSVSVAPLSALDVPALLAQLDRYPYGCSEQITSRAMPLLYANDLAVSEHLSLDVKIEDRLKDAIDRLMARQGANGSFGLWSAGGDDMWLDAYIADFLTRAREKGFAVPQKGFEMVLDRLRNFVANTSEVKGNSEELAYSVYVLARNGRPVMGDLRYLADTKLGEFNTPLSRAQIGAALALLGDRGRAQPVFASASDAFLAAKRDTVSRVDFGSKLRDGAGIVALIAETGVGRGDIGRIGPALDAERSALSHVSTQEMGWLILAAHAMGKDLDKLQLDVNGESRTGAFHRTWRGLALDDKPVMITNRSTIPAQLVVSAAGHPMQPTPAIERGYKIERSYYSMEGKKVDPSKVRQTDRFVVVLRITEPESKYARLLIVDHLPAGLEIDNPKLVEGSETANFNWLKREIEPENTEYRDDRFVAAIDRASGQKAVFELAYIVRAVSPGRYIHPPAIIEDMYRPDRYASTGYGVMEVTKAKP